MSTITKICWHADCNNVAAYGSNYCQPCSDLRATVWTEELAKRERSMRRMRPVPRRHDKEPTYALCKLIDANESYMAFAQEWGNMRAWNKCLTAHEAEALVYGPSNGMLSPQVFVESFGLPQLIDWEFVARYLNLS